MIERGHEHRMVPVSVASIEDGTKVFHLRCEAQQPTPENPTPCAMEEERRYLDGKLTLILVRIHGVWFHPYDLIRSMPLSTEECEACHGDPRLAACETCGGSGLQALGGGPILMPDLHVHA